MQQTDAFRPILLSQTHSRERVLLILAGAFTAAGFLQLALVNPLGQALYLYIVATVLWIVAFASAHIILNRYLPLRDPFILPTVSLLIGWGLLEVARLSRVDFPRQMIWVALGIVVMLTVAIARGELRWLRRYRYTWLMGGLALLAATFIFGVNPSGFGQELWLGIGNVFFQPSEIVKLLMVVFLASYLSEKRRVQLTMRSKPSTRNLAYLGPMLTMWGVAMALLLLQQDLGAAILLFLTFLVMLYLASGKWQDLLIGVVLLIVAVLIGYGLFNRVEERINTWLNPWVNSDLESYQIVQSLIGIGSGGFVGQGLGLGNPVVPAAHTDMPLAVIGEEFGLIGTLALVACYVLLTLRGMRTAARARTDFGQLLAAGLAIVIGMQAWIIMAGNINLIPLTGITLPFVSYGGSSMLVSCAMIGLLLHVSADGA